MTTWFVSRHPGAQEWAHRHGLLPNEVHCCTHLAVEEVVAGDVVIGTLPVNLVAAICARGARYFHLVLDQPQSYRGLPLTAEEMERLGARLEEYRAERVG